MMMVVVVVGVQLVKCFSGLAWVVVTEAPFAYGRHANCVFANTHHSAFCRQGSHTPHRHPRGLLLFRRSGRELDRGSARVSLRTDGAQSSSLSFSAQGRLRISGTFWKDRWVLFVFKTDTHQTKLIRQTSPKNVELFCGFTAIRKSIRIQRILWMFYEMSDSHEWNTSAINTNNISHSTFSEVC